MQVSTPFLKVQFTMRIDRYYRFIGFRTRPMPCNVITIIKPRQNHKFVNILKCDVLQLYLTEDDFLLNSEIPIGDGLLMDSNRFRLIGDTNLLVFPLCVLDGKYGINPPESILAGLT